MKGVSLVAYRGEAVGLIGPNGSGKSTLLRGIAGLMATAPGAIYTQGDPALLGVGAALLQDMTGERNIELGCLAMGMTRKRCVSISRGSSTSPTSVSSSRCR